MTSPTREQIHLVFEPLPSEVPASARVRQLLKHALRTLRLKCVSFEPAKDEAEAVATKGNDADV
jgi:hypothetical protein